MEKNNKKPLTMISGIMTILLAVTLIVFCGYMAVVVFVLLSVMGTAQDVVNWVLGGWILFVLISLVVIAVVITMIVLGVKRIKLSTASNVDYGKRRGSIIGNLVFDAIIFVAMLGFGIAYAITSESGGGATSIFAVVYSVLVLISFIFLLTDMLVFNKRVKTGKIVLENVQTPVAEKQPDEMEKLKQNLTKLKELKDSGALTEEEYEIAKAKELGKKD